MSACLLSFALSQTRMLYTELLRLWDESVQAVDVKDWKSALATLEQINEPTSRTFFNTASAHLALGQLDLAMRALHFCISKDERLAVGFFQRAAVMMQINRLEEALSDCIWAQKHMRGNVVIDYKQLGLRFKLYSWQVWHSALQVLAPLLVPEGVVFRPRKQDVEQLQQRDFLGKPKFYLSNFSSTKTSSTLFYFLSYTQTQIIVQFAPLLMFPHCAIVLQTEDPLANRTILYQMVALYDYASQGSEDLEFSEGDTIDILGEVNEEWLEGHCAGNIGIFPRCFAYMEDNNINRRPQINDPLNSPTQELSSAS
uniref:NADPH oxidase activator 1 n=1 Tax=Acanthochromis polyacanthus TaxID=80966 RepID=A0A3Q1FM03_9TELE